MWRVILLRVVILCISLSEITWITTSWMWRLAAWGPNACLVYTPWDENLRKHTYLSPNKSKRLQFTYQIRNFFALLGAHHMWHIYLTKLIILFMSWKTLIENLNMMPLPTFCRLVLFACAHINNSLMLGWQHSHILKCWWTCKQDDCQECALHFLHTCWLKDNQWSIVSFFAYELTTLVMPQVFKMQAKSIHNTSLCPHLDCFANNSHQEIKFSIGNIQALDVLLGACHI